VSTSSGANPESLDQATRGPSRGEAADDELSAILADLRDVALDEERAELEYGEYGGPLDYDTWRARDPRPSRGDLEAGAPDLRRSLYDLEVEPPKLPDHFESVLGEKRTARIETWAAARLLRLIYGDVSLDDQKLGTEMNQLGPALRSLDFDEAKRVAALERQTEILRKQLARDIRDPQASEAVSSDLKRVQGELRNASRELDEWVGAQGKIAAEALAATSYSHVKGAQQRAAELRATRAAQVARSVPALNTEQGVPPPGSETGGLGM
jgi:hypothetical protein